MPAWLLTLSWIWIGLAGASAVVIVTDLLAGHRQHMAIMNVVWPITALWAGPIALFPYFTLGRLSTRRAVEAAKARGEPPPGKEKPAWQAGGLGATHCGAGCSLGDLVAESLMVVAPLVLFGRKIFGAWVVDYAFAFAFGIVFQYLTIAPMRGLGFREGVKEAVKADALSLTAWQVGMYGWMAVATFAIFGHEIEKSSAVFWFMMQIAMGFGFLTSWPVNVWLIRKGVKERM